MQNEGQTTKDQPLALQKSNIKPFENANNFLTWETRIGPTPSGVQKSS